MERQTPTGGWVVNKKNISSKHNRLLGSRAGEYGKGIRALCAGPRSKTSVHFTSLLLRLLRPFGVFARKDRPPVTRVGQPVSAKLWKIRAPTAGFNLPLVV